MRQLIGWNDQLSSFGSFFNLNKMAEISEPDDQMASERDRYSGH